MSLLDQVIELFVGKTAEKGFSAQNRQSLGLVVLCAWRCFALHLQRANGKRNCDAPALEFVPHIRANGVVDLVDPGMIAHVILDFVDAG